MTVKESNSVCRDNNVSGMIILHDFGSDKRGKFSHINTSLGLVDVTKLTSKFYGMDKTGAYKGFQRVPTAKRVNDIVENWTMTRFEPITVAVMDGEMNPVDGQARVNSAIYRYHKGLTNDPYIPAMILTNVTEEDCALLFAMQDDNTTLVTPRHKLETRIVGKDELIIDFLERLNNNGMPVYDAEKNSVISDFTAIKTYQDIYKKFSKNNNLAAFDRICRTISKAFVVSDGRNKRSFKKHSLCAPIIRMMSEFYSRYASEINDDVFVKNLLRFEPDGIVLKIERNVPSGKEPNSDKGFRYVLTALEIYNDKFANKKRGDRLTYKI